MAMPRLFTVVDPPEFFAEKPLQTESSREAGYLLPKVNII